LEVCRGPECTREVQNVKRGLCKPHAAQELRGVELHPLGLNRGGQNKKYDEDSVCKVEGCERKPKSNWMCDNHNFQIRKYGYIRGEERPVVDKGFSTDRYCEHCKETKNWRKYHLEQNMCTECYRLSLSKRVDVVPVRSPKKKTTMQDLLNFIDSQLA